MGEWWRGAVIYQIYPRSFRDTNGDGVGDVPGITSRLDHVAGLGVDGIWLSPFFTSPMKDFGYDVADYRDVDPLFGTLADFDGLLAEAHRLGLKVIIDQVYSHSSDRHRWFEESRQDRTNPRADWYVWADPKPDGNPPNNWLAVFGGPAWDWEPRRYQYYLHNFLKEQPDLNLHNPQVQQAVLDIAAFWLDRGVDGFRLDVANFFMHDLQLRDNPPRPHPAPDKPSYLQRQIYNRTRPETLAFVPKLRAAIDRYPERMAVAEIAAEDQLATMVAYTDGPERYHTAYSFVFLGPEFGARFIRDSIERMGALSNSAWPSWAFSNHDVVRVATRWGRSAADPVGLRQADAGAADKPARDRLPLPGRGAGPAACRGAVRPAPGSGGQDLLATAQGPRRRTYADALAGRIAKCRLLHGRAVAACRSAPSATRGRCSGGGSEFGARLRPALPRLAQEAGTAHRRRHPLPRRTGAGAGLRPRRRERGDPLRLQPWRG